MSSSTILRLPSVKTQTGLPASTIYAHMAKGLFPRPIHLSERTSAWPQSEIDAINKARIAGKSDDEIRALVKQLEADRKSAA